MHRYHSLHKLIDNCQNIENVKESIKIIIDLVDFNTTNKDVLHAVEDELVKGFEWNDSDRPTII